MKFLCVPCDSPMKLQSVGPPEGGSLSIVYACPECGYEMALLTNPFETQLVQSLGVRIGPEVAAGAASGAAADSAGCPFTAMIPPAAPNPLGEGGATTPGRPAATGEPPVRWTAAAEARLAKIPAFVRPMARAGIERFARERGALEVNDDLLDAAREFFGM